MYKNIKRIFYFAILLLVISNHTSCQHENENYNINRDRVIRIYGTQPHPHRKDLQSHLKICIEGGVGEQICDLNSIFKLSTKISNDYASLLLFESAQELFTSIISSLENSKSNSTANSDLLKTISNRIKHILGVLSFSQGNANEVL